MSAALQTSGQLQPTLQFTLCRILYVRSTKVGKGQQNSCRTHAVLPIFNVLLKRRCAVCCFADVFAAAASLRECSARVNCFTKGATMTPKRWRAAIICDTVLVMTAQQLLNMLGAGATLQQIQLLVSTRAWPCKLS